MAFSDIVHARVENFFAFMKKRSLDLKGKQKLGKPPLGYTDIRWVEGREVTAAPRPGWLAVAAVAGN